MILFVVLTINSQFQGIELEKILVSACFLGAKVRYNAELKTLQHSLLTLWQAQGRVITICPEVAGGLTTPRKPAERQLTTGIIVNSVGEDVSDAFQLGADLALMLCQKHTIRFALLKESSPSCGSSMIYDGNFSNHKIEGQGLTTQLLRKHGIEVFSELTITELGARLDQ